MRIRLGEITPTRAYDALMRRIDDFPHHLAWQFSAMAKAERRKWVGLRGKHKNESCVLVANGPSLARMDLSLIGDVISFGMNRIYLLKDKYPRIPTYYCCMNELVLEQFSSDIDRLSMPKFLNWNQRHLFHCTPSTHFFRPRLALTDGFSSDITRYVYPGGTVTYAALQIIYYLGFQKVVIVGLDHSFKEKGVPNTIEVRNAQRDESHFHPDYFPHGVRWQLPDLLRSELAFVQARLAFEEDGRRIIDATIDGQSNVFEKDDFHRLFPTKRS